MVAEWLERSFAIFKDSNPARTQDWIPLRTMISIVQNYDIEYTAIWKARCQATYGGLQYWIKWALSDTPKCVCTIEGGQKDVSPLEGTT